MAKAGRKEILSENVAKQISKLIEKMPDVGIPITWENVLSHAKKKLGHRFTRQMLSQKEWEGRKIIAEAFKEAKEIQKRKKSSGSPKYSTASRAVLQRRIADLEAKNLAMQELLEKERALKIDYLDAFMNTRCDIVELINKSRGNKF